MLDQYWVEIDLLHKQQINIAKAIPIPIPIPILVPTLFSWHWRKSESKVTQKFLTTEWIVIGNPGL